MSTPEDEHIKSVWLEVSDLKARVRQLEKSHEPIASTINEHDDRLDAHDAELSELKLEMRSRLTSIDLWFQGIHKQVTETHALLYKYVSLHESEEKTRLTQVPK